MHQMRHTHQRVLHLFEWVELLFITINLYKLMRYVPIKIFTFFLSIMYICRTYFFPVLHNYVILIQVPSSLNSFESFVLQSGSTVFIWHGNQCSFEQQQLAAKVAEFLRVRSWDLGFWSYLKLLKHFHKILQLKQFPILNFVQFKLV